MNTALLRFVRCSSILLALLPPHLARAQHGPTRGITSQDAFDDTMAVMNHLFFEVDSLVSVAWPSPKAVLARRAGATVFHGISTRLGESADDAVNLTQRIVAALNQRGLQSRAETGKYTRERCTRTQTEPRRFTTSCTLTDDVGLMVLVGHPDRRGPADIARVTMIVDSRLRRDHPVISLAVFVEQVAGGWRVVSVRRSTGAS